MLNLTLASTVDMRSQVKQALWNCKGREAVTLQSLFVTLGVEFEDYATAIAERIAVLGGEVRGTVRMVSSCSMLQEYPDNLIDGQAHVCALTERLAKYAKAIRGGATSSQDVEDAGTAAVYTEILRRVEKQLGAFEALLYQ
jgi:starvation-inducible DNA-binding protein